MRSKGFKSYIGFVRSILHEKIGTGTPVEKEYTPSPEAYGVFGGGYDGSNKNIIDYVTISTPSNATDFGDLTVARRYLAATSNGTNDRGIFGGGYDGSDKNIIDYVTISNLGNATDFGDLTVARRCLTATSNA